MTDELALQCIASEVEDLRVAVEDLKDTLFRMFPAEAEIAREVEDACWNGNLEAMKAPIFPASPRPSEAQK